MCQRIEHIPPGKGVCLRSHESHRPRIEIRGMTVEELPLGHDASTSTLNYGNAMDKHFEHILTSDLREMMVELGARFLGHLGAFNLAICAC